MDLGPLEPGRLGDRIATPDRKADLAPGDFLREARAELLVETDRETSGELVLIGRRQLRSNNSWMHNSHRLMKGPPRCTLLVHPADAASRGLGDGDLARLGSEAGTVVVPIEVTDAILPGGVSLAHGWGHDRDGNCLGVAREHAGASINDVTSDVHLDTLSGTAAFNDLVVTLQRAGP
jgi:anaerobic selenocysteine-containing dehydrogenase